MNTKTYVAPFASGFTDLHCHILPGVDDGASSEEKSREMLRVAAASGISHLAATSHYSRGLEEQYFAAFQRISALEEAKKLTLLKGCEYDYVFLSELSPERLITLGDSKYFLVDMNQHFIPPSMINVFFKFKLAGYRVLFAHPERMLEGREFDKLLKILNENQIAIQINSGSIIGRYGKIAQRNAFKILDLGLAKVIANDAHCESHFRFDECRKIVSKRYGDDIFTLLTVENPALILQNSAPLAMPLPERKSWWRSIFR